MFVKELHLNKISFKINCIKFYECNCITQNLDVSFSLGIHHSRLINTLNETKYPTSSTAQMSRLLVFMAPSSWKLYQTTAHHNYVDQIQNSICYSNIGFTKNIADDTSIFWMTTIMLTKSIVWAFQKWWLISCAPYIIQMNWAIATSKISSSNSFRTSTEIKYI
jgi:hypothetical protein